MRALRPLWREASLAWWRWARCEIHPLHADLPDIVRNINRLEAERRGAA